jgi:hypothetical protein
LPALSKTLYVTVYVQAVEVFTAELFTIILFVILPSILSVAVAHSSVYVSQTVRVIVEGQFRVITGGVVSTSGVFGVSFEGSFGVLLNVFTLFFSID